MQAGVCKAAMLNTGGFDTLKVTGDVVVSTPSGPQSGVVVLDGSRLTVHYFENDETIELVADTNAGGLVGCHDLNGDHLPDVVLIDPIRAELSVFLASGPTSFRA